MWKSFFLFPVFLFVSLLRNEAADCGPSLRGELRIMWYNVENLFHPANDSLLEDDEFTPEGLMHWTWERYHGKITRLAKVIVAAGQWDPPDVVGLCEVENVRVLEDLILHPVLKPYDYKIIHRESHDHRGMEVACIYREKRITLKDWWVYPPGLSGSHGRTRDQVHLCTTWSESDTLDLFLVHFISKYGGAGATADYRKMQACELVKRIDSVQQRREKNLVIVAGDFNEDFEGYSMEPLRDAFLGMDSMTYIAPAGLEGSYKYHGRWSYIDQFLVTGKSAHLLMKVTIMDLAVLLEPDDLYQGMKPSRTYVGFSYNGGISDHLPILLDITRRPFPVHFEQ